jgi:hypothetical protein
MRKRWKRPTRAEIASIRAECQERGIRDERAEKIIADARLDLFVWGHIQVTDGPEGPRGEGGQRVAHLQRWRPLDTDLRPIQYTYHVPR